MIRLTNCIALAFFCLIMSIPGGVYGAENTRQLFSINTPVLPPFVTADSDGFEDFLAKEVYGRLGFKIDIKHVPAERGLINLNSGMDDGIMSRISGLEKIYPNILEIKENVLTWHFVAFSRRKNIRITDWNSLTAYSTAIVRGWKILEKNVPGGTLLYKVRDVRSLFRMLHSDRVDVAIYALQPGLWSIREFDLKGISPVMQPLASRDKFFYVNKKHKELVPKIAAMLRAVKADGTYQRISKQTLGRLNSLPSKKQPASPTH